MTLVQIHIGSTAIALTAKNVGRRINEAVNTGQW